MPMNDTAITTDPELALIRPFLPPGQRERALVMHELAAAMRDGVFSLSELSLARAKLAWWEAELAHLFEGHPQHPVTRRVAELEGAEALDSGELLELSEGLSMRLDNRLYNDMDELMLHAWRTEGARAVCSARLAGARHEETLDAARNLGLARGLACVVRDFEDERRAGRLRIPVPVLQQAETDAEHLLTAAPEPRTRQALLEPVMTLARDHHTRAMTLCNDRSTLRAPAILAALGIKAAERSYRRPNRGAPGPLARLFTVWRAARRENRLERTSSQP